MTGTVFASLISLTQAKDSLAMALGTQHSPEIMPSATSGGSSGPDIASLGIHSPTSASGIRGDEESSRMLVDGNVEEEEEEGEDSGTAIFVPVLPYRGRLNVARTDMPHIALEGPDPPLNRPNVFHVSGLPGAQLCACGGLRSSVPLSA